MYCSENLVFACEMLRSQSKVEKITKRMNAKLAVTFSSSDINWKRLIYNKAFKLGLFLDFTLSF